MKELEPIIGHVEEDQPAATRRDLVRVLFKRRWIIVTCFVIVTVVTAAGVAMLPPTYQAQAKVLVQTEKQITPTFFSGLAAANERQESDPVNRRLENEMALIEAAPIAARVVNELRLDWNRIYHAPLTHFMSPVIDAAGSFLESAFLIPHRPPSEAETIDAFRASLGVSPGASKTSETTSNVIVVTLKSPEAQTAFEALERVLDLYLGFDRQLSQQAGLTAKELVTRELEAADRAVAAAERTMHDFLAKAGFDPGGPERERSPGRKATDGVVTSARDNKTVSELKATLVGLESELTRARQIYRPESENVRRVEDAIARLNLRLTQEIGLNADNFARYNQLDRTLRAAEARSDDLDKRLAEIGLFLQINQQSVGNRVVIEPPVLPEKSDWKTRLATVFLGSFMGLILGVAVAGLSEYADSTLGSKEAVRRHVGVEVLTTIPKATRRELKAPSPEGRMALTAGALASRMTAGMNGVSANRKHGRSVLVTSARPGEGKTFTATLLAGELVSLGFGNVLLVDASDHDRKTNVDAGVPYVASPQNGNGKGQHPPSTTLTILAAGNGHETPDELVGARLRAFLERERSRFDWIIFDGRSVGERGVAALAHEVDGIVLVIEADATRRHVVRHALDVLDLDDAEKLKVVLNRQRHHIPGFLYERV